MARTRSGLGDFDDLTPLERPGPLRHRVQETLRELIIARTLAPGQHLVESELADRLQVSRGPVREALQALHANGWVDLRPGRGAFVHEPAGQEVDEVFVVRAALESEAAGLAASRTGPADIADLRTICQRGRQAVRASDETAVVAANSAFHLRVATLSGLDLLCGYITALDLRVRWLYKPVVRTRGMHSWDEHDEIIDALVAGDEALAARTMRSHSEQTRQAYKEVSGALGEAAENGRPQEPGVHR
ncbi:MAG TPA: GntR family transcriptional regulator [Nocardioidaceae bacterium]|nr:GntR family transcriptional regulator [Nocardioidaceae bacterium]